MRGGRNAPAVARLRFARSRDPVQLAAWHPLRILASAMKTRRKDTSSAPPAVQLDPLALPGPARDAVLAHLLAYGSYLAAMRLVCRDWRAAVEGASWQDGRLWIALQEGLPIDPLVALLGRGRERVTEVIIGYPQGKEEQWRGVQDAWMRVAPVLSTLSLLPHLVVGGTRGQRRDGAPGPRQAVGPGDVSPSARGGGGPDAAVVGLSGGLVRARRGGGPDAAVVGPEASGAHQPQPRWCAWVHARGEQPCWW